MIRAATILALLCSISVFAATPPKKGPIITKPGGDDQDPPEVILGQRLFRDTRFGQFYAAHFGGDPNRELPSGDPTTQLSLTLADPIPNPYAGSGINCASCHFVDEQRDAEGGGERAYADFARRSPIPDRGDGKRFTVRNSPAFVDSMLPREGGIFLHLDGQFSSIEELVRDTITGRNFGWLPGERSLAVAHLARVLRGDNGAMAGGPGAEELGGAYAQAFQAPKLPPGFRLDLAHASDEQILDGVARAIGAFVRSLVYLQNAEGEFEGSPYDRFLEKNGLPRKPQAGVTEYRYGQRLAQALEGLKKPRFITDEDFSFALHRQSFSFGDKELAGLRIFLGQGNCATCHAPPRFSDYGFHNTGSAQEEYDSIHGLGSFVALHIPSLEERTERFDEMMEATPRHPYAKGIFLDIPAADRPGVTDLGLWNVFANPDFPAPQADLLKYLCQASRHATGDPQGDCSPGQLLPLAAGSFRTLPLRDLGHSAPYLHTGRMDTIEDALAFYVRFSKLAREGAVRNADPELGRVALFAPDIPYVAAFLRSLNEDYQ